MKDKIVIVGMGKVSVEVRRFIEHYDLFDCIGYSVHKAYMNGTEHMGLPVYPLEELDKYIDKETVYTYVAAYPFNYLNRVKRDLYNYVKERNYKVANLISPKAEIYTDNIGDGNWFNDYAYVHYDATIGSNNVMRPFAYIAHYSSIGNHNYMGIRSLMAGNAHCGDQCFFGVHSTVFNTLKIGDKCIIGAGTLIKKNVPSYCLCKMIKGDVVVDQYGPLSIENKLIPLQNPIRKFYDVNIKDSE